MIEDLEPAPSGRRYYSVIMQILDACAWAGAMLGLVGYVLRWSTSGHIALVAISAFGPYLMLGVPITLLWFAARRRWKSTAATVCVLALCVSTQVRLYVAQTAPAHGVNITVMTSNVKLGQADPAAVVAAVRDHHVDVIGVQELTWDEAFRLSRAGLDELLPHRVLSPGANATGVGIWSRFPINNPDLTSNLTFHLATVQLSVPGVSTGLRFVATHMAGPWPDATNWAKDIAKFPNNLRSWADSNPAGAVLVAGDFNATPDTMQFRRLLRFGFADAADQAGAGRTRTYPADAWYPALIAIDHVLTRNAVATSAKTTPIVGSDHRALVTTIRVPTG